MERLTLAILRAESPVLSAANLVEAGIVAQRRGGVEGGETLDRLIAALGIIVVPVSPEQAAMAREAPWRFGKGQHPAALNYGDCFSYALAKERGEPLLFKGNDFSRTDLLAATY